MRRPAARAAAARAHFDLYRHTHFGVMLVHRRKRSIPAIIAPGTESVTDYLTVHVVLDGVSVHRRHPAPVRHSGTATLLGAM